MILVIVILITIVGWNIKWRICGWTSFSNYDCGVNSVSRPFEFLLLLVFPLDFMMIIMIRSNSFLPFHSSGLFSVDPLTSVRRSFQVRIIFINIIIIIIIIILIIIIIFTATAFKKLSTTTKSYPHPHDMMLNNTFAIITIIISTSSSSSSSSSHHHRHHHHHHEYDDYLQDIQAGVGRSMRSLMAAGSAIGHRMLGMITRAPSMIMMIMMIRVTIMIVKMVMMMITRAPSMMMMIMMIMASSSSASY